MIESLAIRNFRGIRRGEMNRFRRINVLVGPNNSGKSAVVEALYLASTVGRPASVYVDYGKMAEAHAAGGMDIDSTGRAHYDVQVARRDLLGEHPLVRILARHNSAERDQSIVRFDSGTLKVSLSDRDVPFTAFDLTPEGDFADEVEAQNTGYFGLKTQEIDMTERREEQGTEGRDPASILASSLMQCEVEPLDKKQLLFCWRPELTYYHKGSAAWLVEGKLPLPQHTLLYDSALIQGHLPLAFYERILLSVPGWSQQIAKHFGPVFDLDYPFTVQFVPIGPDRQWMQGWIASEAHPALPIDAFGDGARSVFKLLTPLVAMASEVDHDTPGLLLWEEPEAFQNPQTLGMLLAEVIHIIKERPIQLFMVSHSLEVVAHITDMLQKGQIDDDDVLTFRMDLRDGQLHSSWFDSGSLLTRLESSLDPRVWKMFMPPLQFSLREETV